MKIRRFSVELTTRSLRIALTGALICSAIFPPAHGSAQSSSSLETFPGELPKPIATRVAKEWFFAFRSGQVDRRKLSDAVNNELSASVLQKEMRTLQRFGTPRSFEYLRVARFGGLPPTRSWFRLRTQSERLSRASHSMGTGNWLESTLKSSRRKMLLRIEAGRLLGLRCALEASCGTDD